MQQAMVQPAFKAPLTMPALSETWSARMVNQKIAYSSMYLFLET
jgi:hypothetical protein